MLNKWHLHGPKKVVPLIEYVRIILFLVKMGLLLQEKRKEKECKKLQQLFLFFFAFWKHCFPRLPRIFCFSFSTNVTNLSFKTMFLMTAYFFDVALDVTFFQSLIFVRKILLDAGTTFILKQTKVILDCKRFSHNYKIECFDAKIECFDDTIRTFP